MLLKRKIERMVESTYPDEPELQAKNHYTQQTPKVEAADTTNNNSNYNNHDNKIERKRKIRRS